MPAVAFFGVGSDRTTISKGFDFTFGPGVYPSVCSIHTVPHTSGLQRVGTLMFGTTGSLGINQAMQFDECLLEEPVLEAGRGGQHWRLPIKDRRWKWQQWWGSVYGHYNIRKPDQSYLREKTPQELASLLLDEMGESGYDVGRLPNNARPEIHWDAAHPATELELLCNSLGCIVNLNLFTNKVELWPVGQGNPLPSGTTKGKSYAPIYPAEPERIEVIAGPTLWQGTLGTEAVGLDTDGKWKPIDDLSYKPAVGWGKTAVSGGFPEVTGTYDQDGRTLQKRDLASSTVFRCYRVTGLASGGWVPSQMQDPNLAPQSLKDWQLYNVLADEEISLVDGGSRPINMRVYAQYFEIGYGTKATAELWKDGYSFDTSNGIVKFGEPLWLSGGVDVIPAEVRIETSFNAGRDGVYDRTKINATTGVNWTTPTRVVNRSDIVTKIMMRYGGDDQITRVDTNLVETTTDLEYWQDAALAEYGLRNGGTVRYHGLLPITLDGLTQQVTWSGGNGRPPTTTASQAQRHNRYVPSLEDHRRALKVEKVAAEQNAIAHKVGILSTGGVIF